MYALDFSEKVILTQHFWRLTPERIKLSVKPYNKIKSALSFKKRKEKKKQIGIKIIPYSKRFSSEVEM